MKTRTYGSLVLTAIFCFPPLSAEAARIRVSQETRPSQGNFDENILGYIDSLDAPGTTAAEFYAYNEAAEFSYGGSVPRLHAGTSHVFFVTTKEGVTLFVVHDRPNDEDGGAAVLALELDGDPDGARFLVFDDPFSDWDSYTSETGDRIFAARHRWFACCTDGLVLGTLEGSWRVFMEFPLVDEYAGRETVHGLRFWTALSGAGSSIPLELEKGRRVRFDPIRSLVQRMEH